jgi:hypothetical protein
MKNFIEVEKTDEEQAEQIKKWMPKREYMYHYYNKRLQNDLWSYYMVVYWYKPSLPQYCGLIGTSYHYHNIVEFIIAGNIHYS